MVPRTRPHRKATTLRSRSRAKLSGPLIKRLRTKELELILRSLMRILTTRGLDDVEVGGFLDDDEDDKDMVLLSLGPTPV